MAAEPSDQRTVEFFLSSLWSWLPEGRKRILEALESCDLEQAYFAWDEKFDWFHIKCLEDDKDYIMNEYLKAQSEMEIELKEKDVIRDDGNLIPTVKNHLIGTSRSRVAIPDESDHPEVAARTETERVGIECPKGQGRVEKRIERQAVSETETYLF
ncbi:hypothetical protein LA080_001163 [Diaporthe eres]|uniref:Uncharacterized protein n=1 Tax=Diaporthe vaccinii TaxID=105482 RepID=A0ABR4F859_9PEZI|nr:hypothetical protein LA080_001163 [Diaporthe eres]